MAHHSMLRFGEQPLLLTISPPLDTLATFCRITILVIILYDDHFNGYFCCLRFNKITQQNPKIFWRIHRNICNRLFSETLKAVHIPPNILMRFLFIDFYLRQLHLNWLSNWFVGILNDLKYSPLLSKKLCANHAFCNQTSFNQWRLWLFSWLLYYPSERVVTSE